MPSFDLPALARRNTRRANITLRDIVPTQAHAQELAALYMPIVRAWEEALPRILAGYEPITSDALTTDAPADQQAAIDAVEGVVARLVAVFQIGLRDWTVSIERWHRGKWSAAVKAGTGVDLGTLLTGEPVRETVDAFLARNTALIRDISDQARGRIADATFRAYQNRTPPRDLAKELREATGMARKRAVRVAADQNVKLSSALDRQRQAEAGVRKFKWRSSHKLHFRPEHAARDGKVYPYSDPPQDMPGQLPYCGCRAQAWLDLMDEI